jgi:predicted nucleic acid-binding protein
VGGRFRNFKGDGMAIIIISDTSPLSGLAIINQLSILPKLYQKIIIPTAVKKELTFPENPQFIIDSINNANWLEERIPTNISLINSLQIDNNLDVGESEAICLALELSADFLVIDERLGRKEAKQKGLKIIGVLGILLVAKNKGLIPKIKPVLNQLINEANFRVSPILYQQILKDARE